MSAEIATPGKFEIGHVLRHTFQAISHNFLLFLALATIANIPEFAISWLALGWSLLKTVGAASDNFHYVVSTIEILIRVALSQILQAALVRPTIAELSGGTRSSWAGNIVSVTKSLPSLVAIATITALPLILLDVTRLFGETVAFILLVVPMVMLAMCWSVAIPVFALERRTVLLSLERSWDLTRGFRWPIFFLFVIVSGAAVLLNLGTGLAVGLVRLQGRGPVWALLLVSIVADILITTIRATMSSAIYYELRSTKEGADPSSLASVFE